MVTLAPSSTPRVRDSAIEMIEVKLTLANTDCAFQITEAGLDCRLISSNESTNTHTHTKNLFSSRGENDEHVFFDYQSVGVSLP